MAATRTSARENGRPADDRGPHTRQSNALSIVDRSNRTTGNRPIGPNAMGSENHGSARPHRLHRPVVPSPVSGTRATSS